MTASLEGRESGLSNPVPAATTDRVAAAGLIAILRAPDARHFLAVTTALVEAGVGAIEITLSAPDALDLLPRLVAEFKGSAVIGAGTVLTADEAEACIEAGASFLVSPIAALDVVASARIAGVAAYPAGLTPTEIVTAFRSGATAVKLFPASAVGPDFLTDLRGPFPNLPVIPTGGIGIDDIPRWLRAGATAVGLGGTLIGAAARDGGDLDGLRSRAHRALELVDETRVDSASSAP
jgi:2-dehydro-3-deoxyphosphogluconate aldolase / (4S)-4-hydroxy-2-oxoglutarate aldolase